MKNLSNIDLNLLVVFRMLCREKNTVRAGEKLGLGQPTVSHALKRLRLTFEDPLFVRASRGLVPTRRALELAAPVEEFLGSIERLFNSERAFDPAQATVTFKIATTDYFEQVVLPQILSVMGKEAPGCTLISRPTMGTLPKEELESGDIDLAIAGFFGALPENHYSQTLYSDDYVCVAGKNHPRLKENLTLKRYADQKHILISPQGDMRAQSEIILKREGYKQHFVAGVASFTSPGWIVSSSDLLLTCPRRLARAYEKFLPVKIHELPFKMKEISIVQVWHGRNHGDPAHLWFRRLIHKICQQ